MPSFCSHPPVPEQTKKRSLDAQSDHHNNPKQPVFSSVIARNRDIQRERTFESSFSNFAVGPKKKKAFDIPMGTIGGNTTTLMSARTNAARSPFARARNMSTRKFSK